MTDVVDVADLPKALGGDAVTVNKETGEEDETCCQGVEFPAWSAMRGEIEAGI